MRDPTSRAVRALPLTLGLALTAITQNALAGDPIVRAFASDGVSGDNLGEDVAYDGTLAVLGAPRDAPNGTQSGSAYVFDMATGEQMAHFVPADGAAFDSLGWAVGVSGPLGMAATYKDDDLGQGSGSAYVFDTSTGQELHKLLANDGATGDQLGFSGGLDGALVVLGAPGDDDQGSSAGAAYVFDAVTGQQLHKLKASDGAADALFGNSSAIHGNTVIVGAPGAGTTNQGAAYVFDAVTGAQLAKLTSGSAANWQYFGREVDVSADRAIVGAPGLGAGGGAFLFSLSSFATLDSWTPYSGNDDNFGTSVGIDGDLAVVGNWGHGGFGPFSGEARAYRASDGAELGALSAHDATLNRRFGHAVAVHGERALVVSLTGVGVGINTGVADLFHIDGSPWENLALGRSGSEGPPSLFTVGDLSANSDLSFAVGDAALETNAYLVLGLLNLSAPFKNGTLVPSPDLILGPFATGLDGRFSFATVFPAGGVSGVPIHGQVWIQDGGVLPAWSATNGVVAIMP